jgi:hypothetical protein
VPLPGAVLRMGVLKPSIVLVKIMSIIEGVVETLRHFVEQIDDLLE